MFPLYFLSLLAAAAMAGCSTQAPPRDSLVEAQVAVDQQILQASARIQRSQAELYQVAALSSPIAQPEVDIKDDGQPVSLSWQGDASELIGQMAIARGLGFVSTGVKLPLPVNLTVKNESFGQVLQLLRSQIGYRASVRQEGDRIVLSYNRPQP